MTNKQSKNNHSSVNVTEEDVVYLELKNFELFVKYVPFDKEINIFYKTKYIHFINIKLIFLFKTHG